MRKIDFIDEILSFILDNNDVCSIESVDNIDDTCTRCVIFDECTYDDNVANIDTICYRIYNGTVFDGVNLLTDSRTHLINVIRYSYMNITSFNRSLYSSIYLRNKMGVNISSHNFN